MARGKQTFRMTTVHTPRSQPSVALNPNGSVQRDPQKDRLKERIRKMKAEFCRAKNLMNEALKIMGQVEQEFLDLEPNFNNLPELKENN